MIQVNQLPRDPRTALRLLLLDLADGARSNDKLSDLRSKGAKTYILLQSSRIMAEAAARRIEDQGIRETILSALEMKESDTLVSFRSRAESVAELAAALELDNHFFQLDDIYDFDRATLSDQTTQDVRGALNTARELAQVASYLSNHQRRLILHRLSQAENALYESRTKVQVFAAMAGDLLPILRKAGEDAKPLAEAVAMAQGKVQDSTAGQKKIAKEAEPKQITHEK